MNKMVKKILTVMVSFFVFLGVVTSPVQAKGPETSGTNGWNPWGWLWGWGWTQPTDPEPAEEAEEEPVEEEEPVIEEAPAVYSTEPLYAESANYAVTVSFDESAMIPEGTYAWVTEYAEGSIEFEEAKAAVLGSVDNGKVGVAAFDITLYNGDTVIEPDASVSVSVELKGLPAEAVAAADTLELNHLDESTGEIVVETVATPENIVVTDDSAVAEFTVAGFSTFVLTWENAGGEEVSATIVWGEMVAGEFVPFDESEIVYLDTSGDKISIENIYPDHYCSGAEYFEIEGSGGINIQTELYKGENGWQYNQIIIDPETGELTYELHDIANNSVIHVNYYIPSEGELHPHGADDSSVPTPETTKTVTDNGDGTYRIELTVEGNTAEEDDSHYANVLIILDATDSMRDNMAGGGGEKWAAAKSAINNLVDTLTTGENAGNSNKIDFSLAIFGGRTTTYDFTYPFVHTNNWHETAVNWTKNENTIKTTLAGLDPYPNNATYWGTNWEGGFTEGLTLANSVPDNDPLFTIFITDGDPNCTNTTSFNIGNWEEEETMRASAAAATDEARQLAGISNLYGVFCGAGTTSNSYIRLNSIITGAGQGGIKTIGAMDSTTLSNEFADIAETILKYLGPSDVEVDDGVPSLARVSASVIGEANAFKYEISHDGENFETWEDAPRANYSQANGVTWDLSEEGALMSGNWYRLSFDVWPSQAAYDLIADLNNGLKDYDTDLTDEQKTWITGSKESGYTMKTNTHLNTTYTYNNTTYTDPFGFDVDDMDLPADTITAVKTWANDLDARTGSPVQLIVTKDEKPYLSNEKTFVSAPDWTTDEIYISMGNITVHDGEAVIREYGHDYTMIEPEELEYYWELSAEIYHPMVINGDPYMLIRDDSATVDNQNVFEINGHNYKKTGEGVNTIHAKNDRRSYLNITKNVEEEDAPADAYFKFELNVYDPSGPFVGDEDYVSDEDDDLNSDLWFSIYDPVADATVMDTTFVKDGQTVALVSGGDVTQKAADGFWHFGNVENGQTITVYMKAGWNLRVINLRSKTEYTVSEIDEMYPGFVFDKVEATADGDSEATPAETDGMTASGIIDKPNTDYTVTFTNKYLGFFYVYHSSDNTVEKIYLTDERITEDGKFNIYAETKTGTLYGGYYEDYALKSAGYDSDGLTYDDTNWSKDEGGQKYVGKKALWQGFYTVNGTAMTPQKDITYYLKEVPVYYLRPYTHYTYYKPSNKINYMWFMSGIDDSNYNDFGYEITVVDKDGVLQSADKASASLTITNNGGSIKLTALNIYKQYGMVNDAYLAYYKNTLGGTYVKQDGTVYIRQFWTTKDGITVFGDTTRKIEINDAIVGNMTFADTKD